MHPFRHSANLARAGALLLAALLAAPALARNDCEKLPNQIKLDGGRIVLERDGEFWKLIKGRLQSGSASSVSFTYFDHDDDKHVYRFIYRTGKQFSCEDSGRYAN